MPDMATALRQALDDWEPPTKTAAPEPAPAPAPAPAKAYFTVTNNVCRVTFEYVRDNPGKTRIEVAKALEDAGAPPALLDCFTSSLFDRLLMGLLLYFTAVLQRESLSRVAERASTTYQEGAPRRACIPRGSVCNDCWPHTAMVDCALCAKPSDNES